MKKTVLLTAILVVIMLIFSGCGANEAASQNTQGKEVLSQLTLMKEQSKKPKEMFDYLNQSIKTLTKDEATEAVGLLISALEGYEETYNEQLFTGSNPDLMFQYFEFAFDYSKIELVKEPELKELLYDISLGGFKIMDTEGTFMVMVDYEALKTFNEYVDEELKTYIEIMAIRYNNPTAVDAGIMLKPEELEDKIMQMEAYVKASENQQRKEMIRNIYLGDIMIYMSGTDNSPVFDYDTGIINTEMFKVYEGAAARYKDTVFGKIMSKYVEVLKAEDFINTDLVQDFILDIGSIVDEELGK